MKPNAAVIGVLIIYFPNITFGTTCEEWFNFSADKFLIEYVLWRKFSHLVLLEDNLEPGNNTIISQILYPTSKNNEVSNFITDVYCFLACKQFYNL